MILDAAELEAFVREQRARGRRIAFTNGVFDILHPGHLRYLEASRRHGDLLVVAVNSDRSVRAIKGESRPVTPEDERAEMLHAMHEEGILLAHDLARHLEDGVGALVQRLHQPVGRGQAVGDEGALLIGARAARDAGVVAPVDQHAGQRVAVQLHVPEPARPFRV